jgi:hypothetical protein
VEREKVKGIAKEKEKRHNNMEQQQQLTNTIRKK